MVNECRMLWPTTNRCVCSVDKSPNDWIKLYNSVTLTLHNDGLERPPVHRHFIFMSTRFETIRERKKGREQGIQCDQFFILVMLCLRWRIFIVKSTCGDINYFFIWNKKILINSLGKKRVITIHITHVRAKLVRSLQLVARLSL